jgi:paraquat-inducible protein A
MAARQAFGAISRGRAQSVHATDTLFCQYCRNNQRLPKRNARMRKQQLAKYLNLALVVAFPVAWFAPLLRTGLLPEWQMPSWLGGSTLFAPDTITVISGLQKLWETDVFLAIAVTFFALMAPMLKCLGMGLIHFNLLSSSTRPAIALMGKLAMADIFIVSLYIVVAKGIGIGQVEAAWGLYLFTASVMVSLLISFVETAKMQNPSAA